MVLTEAERQGRKRDKRNLSSGCPGASLTLPSLMG